MSHFHDGGGGSIRPNKCHSEAVHPSKRKRHTENKQPTHRSTKAHPNTAEQTY